MERVKEFYGNIDKKLNKNEDFKDVANKLLQREADIEINFKNGKNLSAILLYKTTHIHSDKAVHSVELQAMLQEIKSLYLWDMMEEEKLRELIGIMRLKILEIPFILEVTC